MRRSFGLEIALLGFFSVCWLGSVVMSVTGLQPRGLPAVDLYVLYGLAALGGWLAGNLFVHRSAGLPRSVRRRLLVVYLVGPPGVLYLLHGLAPEGVREQAPLAPLYAFAVLAIFFLVPVTLRRADRGSARQPPEPPG